MQLLSGRMYNCSDQLIHMKKDCVGFDDNGNARSWDRYDVHFDNIYQAVRSMFILATQDDWPEHMVSLSWRCLSSRTRFAGRVVDESFVCADDWLKHHLVLALHVLITHFECMDADCLYVSCRTHQADCMFFGGRFLEGDALYVLGRLSEACCIPCWDSCLILISCVDGWGVDVKFFVVASDGVTPQQAHAQVLRRAN